MRLRISAWGCSVAHTSGVKPRITAKGRKRGQSADPSVAQMSEWAGYQRSDQRSCQAYFSYQHGHRGCSNIVHVWWSSPPKNSAQRGNSRISAWFSWWSEDSLLFARHGIALEGTRHLHARYKVAFRERRCGAGSLTQLSETVWLF